MHQIVPFEKLPKTNDELADLLKTASPFILRGMGAPAEWETLALWR